MSKLSRVLGLWRYEVAFAEIFKCNVEPSTKKPGNTKLEKGLAKRERVPLDSKILTINKVVTASVVRTAVAM
jgi:hypothetical protein